MSKKEQDVQKKWIQRINRAKSVRKNWKEKFKVDLALEYFDGQQNPGYPSAEWITINKVYSHLKALLPTLYKADPYFYMKVRRSFDPNPLNIALWDMRAEIRQSMLNYLKVELKLKQKTRLSIQDAQFSYGVCKVHHMADIEDNPDMGMPLLSETGEIMLDDGGEPLMEPEGIPINERYAIERVHPDDFLWDENAGPLSDTWTWVGQRVIITHEEANEDKRFSKKALKDIKGKGITKDDEFKQREQRKKGDTEISDSESNFSKFWDSKQSEQFVYWELYDLKKKVWVVIAEEGDIPLINEQPIPPGIENHPFAILRFTLRDSSPYPIPPISQGLDAQKEYNLARSQVQTHRKRFNRKYEVGPGVEEEELSKLESGEDGTIIRVQQLNSILPIKDAPLDQQRYLEIGALNQDLIELFGGSTDESRGIAGADSATQAGILDKRLEVKEGDAMGEVIDFVLDIARKLDQLVQVHITKDEALRVKGPQGEFWKLVRTEDYESINGEFEYSVNVGSTMPQLPQMERASWIAFLTLLQGFPQLLLSPTLIKEMAELHHLDNEALVNELLQIGKQMMSGQIPSTSPQGSQPGQGEDRPVSAIAGQFGGQQSTNQPGAGNFPIQ